MQLLSCPTSAQRPLLCVERLPAQPSGRLSFTSASYNTQQTGCVLGDAGAVTCETHLRSSVTGEGSSGSSLLSPPSVESFLSPALGLSEEGRTQHSSAPLFQSAHQPTIIMTCLMDIIIKVDHQEGFHLKDLAICWQFGHFSTFVRTSAILQKFCHVTGFSSHVTTGAR